MVTWWSRTGEPGPLPGRFALRDGHVADPRCQDGLNERRVHRLAAADGCAGAFDLPAPREILQRSEASTHDDDRGQTSHSSAAYMPSLPARPSLTPLLVRVQQHPALAAAHVHVALGAAQHRGGLHTVVLHQPAPSLAHLAAGHAQRVGQQRLPHRVQLRVRRVGRLARLPAAACELLQAARAPNVKPCC